MEKIDFIGNILRYSFLNLAIFYVFIKTTNYRDITRKKNIIVIISSIIIGILYAILINYLNSLSTILILYFLLSLVIAYITKNKIDHSIVVILMSSAICFIGFILSTLLTAAVIKLPIFNVHDSNPIILLISASIESLLLYKFFRIKRFINRFFVPTE